MEIWDGFQIHCASNIETHESYEVFIGHNIFGTKASLLTHFNALETTLINSI